MTARMLIHPCRPLLLAAASGAGRVDGLPRIRSETRGQEASPSSERSTRPAGRDAKGVAVTVRDRAAGRAGNHHQAAASHLDDRAHSSCGATASSIWAFSASVYVYGLTLAGSRGTDRRPVERRRAEADSRYRRRSTWFPCAWPTIRASTTTCWERWPTPGRFKAGGNDTVLDAILQAGLKSEQPPRKGLPGAPARLGRRGPGVQDRLVRHQGPRRHPDELPAFSRRPSGRPRHQAAGVDQELAGQLRTVQLASKHQFRSPLVLRISD